MMLLATKAKVEGLTLHYQLFGTSDFRSVKALQCGSMALCRASINGKKGKKLKITLFQLNWVGRKGPPKKNSW